MSHGTLADSNLNCGLVEQLVRESSGSGVAWKPRKLFIAAQADPANPKQDQNGLRDLELNGLLVQNRYRLGPGAVGKDWGEAGDVAQELGELEAGDSAAPVGIIF
jgi:hypothetical protein